MSVNAVGSGFRPEAVSKAPRRRFPVLISCVRKRVSIPVGSRCVSRLNEFLILLATDDASVVHSDERKPFGVRRTHPVPFRGYVAARPSHSYRTDQLPYSEGEPLLISAKSSAELGSR